MSLFDCIVGYGSGQLMYYGSPKTAPVIVIILYFMVFQTFHDKQKYLAALKAFKSSYIIFSSYFDLK